MHNAEFLCYFTCGCELKANKEATTEVYLSKNKEFYNNEWNYVLLHHLPRKISNR